MGNCCGKPSASGGSPFAKPGRTLGEAPETPAAPRHDTIPQSPKRASMPPSATTPGRAVGGSSTSGGSDPRSAAAKAAEERAAKANEPKGRLGKALAKEKQQTRTNTLEAVSNQERQQRAVDQATKDLQHS